MPVPGYSSKEHGHHNAQRRAAGGLKREKMRAFAAKASTQESTAKSQKKAVHNQTQPAAPANVPVIPGSIPSIQRKSLCPCDGGCPTCSGLQNQIQSLKGSGQSLSTETRGFFEPRFNRDFSRVRVHSDPAAAALARSVNARAFTLGTNIVFNAGQFLPNTNTGKRLLAHELTHVLQQQSGVKRLQRTEDNIISCNRSGARACLVHLHNSERVALEVAKDLFCRYCVNLVHLDNSGNRCRVMRFEVNGHTCCADPNRLFDLDLINTDTDPGSTEPYMPARIEWNQKWNDWNNGNCRCEEACKSDPLKRQAFEVARRKSRELRQAIDNCRGQSESGEAVETQTLPIVAFHGNLPTNVGRGQRSLSICSYCRGDNEWDATEQNPVNHGGTIIANPNNCCVTTSSTRPPFFNPHIVDGQDVDDFILVTRPADFLAFATSGRNVVLQSGSPPRDGSLSVALSSTRYINIEAQRPFSVSSGELSTSQDLNERRTRQQARDIQHTMGTDALSQVLGLTPGVDECPVTSTTGCPDCESPLTTSRQTTPPHTPPQCPVSNEPDCQSNQGDQETGETGGG